MQSCYKYTYFSENLRIRRFKKRRYRLAAMRRTFPAKEKGLFAAADRPSG
jgi:hypothetical protein